MSTRLRFALVALFLCSTLGIQPSLGNTDSDENLVNFQIQGPVVSTPPLSCKDYKDDRAYLLDVNVDISAGPNGPIVRVTRASDGTVLKESYKTEQFYVDDSAGALGIQYQIVPQCGGFDVVYTLSNPSAVPQPHPEFRVEGLRLQTSGDIYMLSTKDYGNVRKITNPDGSLNTTFFVGPYPTMVYSPVIVAHDSVFAAGSALHYPQLSYRKSVQPLLDRVISGPQIGTWRHRYRGFTEDLGSCSSGLINATIPPGEQREYTITLRFSGQRYWLQTLFPYKQFFNSLYSASADIRPKDRRPVMGAVAALAEANTPVPGEPDPWETNPRSYVTFIGLDGNKYRVDTDGWGPFTDLSISTMTTYGYERIMIWTPSGLYGPPGHDGVPFSLNFPAQFMSDWLPMLVLTQRELSAFANNKISLGFWWGHSSSIPKPLRWNPLTLTDAEYTNPRHRRFLSNEVKLAHQRGTKEIGLDAFVCMPTHERYVWVDDMKKLAPGALLIHEGMGPDILHSKMANFYVPPIWNGEQVEAPDVLSAYLNPGSEIWLYLGYCPGQPSSELWCNRGGVQNFIRWGFTPVVSWPLIDVKGLDYTLVPCFDGLDNDGDGFADWPYDSGCASAAGLSEQPIVPHPPDSVTSEKARKAQ